MSDDPHEPEGAFLSGCRDVLTIVFYLVVAAGVIGGIMYLVGR